MKRVIFIFFILAGLSAASLLFLANWQIPAPAYMVTKIIDDDQLPK